MSKIPSTVLALGAHPDDIEFMMAGTLILLKEAGWEAHYMNLCSGSCGTQTDDVPAICAKRKAEAEAACRLIGAQLHDSLVHDLELAHTPAVVAQLTAVIRQVKPSIILLPSPNDYMEDHMNASRVGVTAAFARGMRNFSCVPRVPPIVDDVTLYHALPYGLMDGMRRKVRAGQYVDIASVIAKKREMLACHATQKLWLDASQGLDAYLETMTAMSRDVGKLSGRFELAEGWRRHSWLGFSATEIDPLSAALGPRCIVDEQYEAALQGKDS